MNTEIFGDPISTYSRADALRDGVLIEADPNLCKEAGVKWPVAISDHLWGYIEPDNLDSMPGQSVSGRLWDLLWMFTQAARYGSSGSRLTYRVSFQMKHGPGIPKSQVVSVIAAFGPGDEGEPVITLMLPEDD